MSYQLFPVGRIWHYRFQIDGMRRQRSTGETDRLRAEAVANRAFRHAHLWARGDRAVPTLSEVVGQWIEVHRPTASAAHVKIVETFGRLHVYGLANVLIDELTTSGVELARVEHLKTHAPASANQWLKVLKLLCNWAVRRGVMPAIPFNVRALKVQKQPRALLPTTLALAWLAAIDEREGIRLGVRTAVRLMIAMGLREIETITARWEWLDWDRRIYTPGKTKGREADPIPVPMWLLDWLRHVRQTAGLMVSHPDGKPYASGFTRAAMLAANKAVHAPHVTAHRLRGTFATLLSEAGTPVQSIQRALRHKNLTTTAAYLEVNMQTVADGQRLIAERIGFRLPASIDGATVANLNSQCKA